MDTSKYIKPCPRCGTSIEPKRHASWGVHVLAGVAGVCGGVIGFAFGGPVGGAGGAAATYAIAKHNIMSIEDDHDENQWFKYKCPKCGCNWKEKIHTNDHPDDPSWLINSTGYH